MLPEHHTVINATVVLFTGTIKRLITLIVSLYEAGRKVLFFYSRDKKEA